jgi:hypothetical protein
MCVRATRAVSPSFDSRALRLLGEISPARSRPLDLAGSISPARPP